MTCPLVASHARRLWAMEGGARVGEGQAATGAAAFDPSTMQTGIDLLQNTAMYAHMWRCETTLAAMGMTQYGLPKRFQMYVEHPAHTARAVEVTAKLYKRVRHVSYVELF